MIALPLLALGALLTVLEMSRAHAPGPTALTRRALAASGPASVLFLGSALALCPLAPIQALALGAAGTALALLALAPPHRQPQEQC